MNQFIILSIILYCILMFILHNCGCIRKDEPKIEDNTNIPNISNIHYKPLVKKRQRAGST